MTTLHNGRPPRPARHRAGQAMGQPPGTGPAAPAALPCRRRRCRPPGAGRSASPAAPRT